MHNEFEINGVISCRLFSDIYDKLDDVYLNGNVLSCSINELGYSKTFTIASNTINMKSGVAKFEIKNIVGQKQKTTFENLRKDYIIRDLTDCGKSFVGPNLDKLRVSKRDAMRFTKKGALDYIEIIKGMQQCSNFSIVKTV
jgi:hypothetical protein